MECPVQNLVVITAVVFGWKQTEISIQWELQQKNLLAKWTSEVITVSGLILGLRPANERRHYFVTTSLIGCAKT